jgi:hypothetical protein
MPQTIRINDKLSQEEFANIAAPLNLDLIEVFKEIEADMIDMMENLDSYTQDELEMAIERLVGQ